MNYQFVSSLKSWFPGLFPDLFVRLVPVATAAFASRAAAGASFEITWLPPAPLVLLSGKPELVPGLPILLLHVYTCAGHG